MSPHETLARISGGGDCMTTPKANNTSKNDNSVAEYFEQVNTSLALSTPTSHNTTRTEIQEVVFPIQSGPSSTFKGNFFTTPNSSKFIDFIFSTEVDAPSLNSKNFGMPNHDSQGKLPHITDPYSFKDFSPPQISTPLATTRQYDNHKFDPLS